MASWTFYPDKSGIPQNDREQFPDRVLFQYIVDGNITVDVNEVLQQGITNYICDGRSYEINLKRSRYNLTRGLKPDKIVGITKIDKQLTFVLKWENTKDDKVDFINAKVVYEKWPNLALEYYHARLHYTSPSGEKRLMK